MEGMYVHVRMVPPCYQLVLTLLSFYWMLSFALWTYHHLWTRCIIWKTTIIIGPVKVWTLLMFPDNHYTTITVILKGTLRSESVLVLTWVQDMFYDLQDFLMEREEFKLCSVSAISKKKLLDLLVIHWHVVFTGLPHEFCDNWVVTCPVGIITVSLLLSQLSAVMFLVIIWWLVS